MVVRLLFVSVFNQLSGRVKGVRGLPVTGVEKIMASMVGCPSAVFACVRLALRLMWSRRVRVLFSVLRWGCLGLVLVLRGRRAVAAATCQVLRKQRACSCAPCVQPLLALRARPALASRPTALQTGGSRA